MLLSDLDMMFACKQGMMPLFERNIVDESVQDMVSLSEQSVIVV